MNFHPITYIKKLFDNKKFLMTFSIICAVIFWLVIDISENPTREVTISDIQITVSNQRDDNGNELKVVSEYDDILSVTVSGPGYIVTTVKKEDINITIKPSTDISKPGTYTMDISAAVGVTDCTVVKVSQTYLTVVYDYDTAAEIPVEIDTTAFQQILPQDREIFRSFLKNNADGAEMSSINVTGPSEVIGSIQKAVVTPTVPADATPESHSFEGTLVFYDNEGKPVDASQLVYNTDTYVRVVVYKVADVPLKPTFTNLPLCYSSSDKGLPPFELKRYNGNARASEQLQTVKARGPVEVMDELVKTGLKLSPIDFMQVKADSTSFNVSFMLENGVEIVDGTEEVTVELKLGSLRTTTVDISPSSIKFVGLPDGLTAGSAITNKAIRVTVCYDRNETSATSAKNGIVLMVDCSGITTPSSVTKPITATTKSKDVFAWAIAISPIETTVVVK